MSDVTQTSFILSPGSRPVVEAGAGRHAGLGPLEGDDGPDLAGSTHVLQLVGRLERVGPHGPGGGRVHGVVTSDDGVPHPSHVHLVADGGYLVGGWTEVPGGGQFGQRSQQVQPLESCRGSSSLVPGVLQQGERPLDPDPLLCGEVVPVHPARVGLGARGFQIEPVVIVSPDQLLAVVARLSLSLASSHLPGRVLLRPQLEEAEGVLGPEEARHHGHHRAQGRADVGRVHEVAQAELVDVLPVSVAEEASPLAHLQHHQVDEVDHGDHQRHQQQTLRLLDRELTEAAEHDGDDPAEHVLQSQFNFSKNRPVCFCWSRVLPKLQSRYWSQVGRLVEPS